jgi:hypothetical protein
MKETMIVSLEIGLVHNIRAVTSEGDRIFSDKPLVTTIDHSQISNTSLQTMQPWQLDIDIREERPLQLPYATAISMRRLP